MEKKKLIEFVPSEVVEENDTKTKFKAWLNGNFTTLDKLRKVRDRFLEFDFHLQAELVFKAMKLAAIRESKTRKKHANKKTLN